MVTTPFRVLIIDDDVSFVKVLQLRFAGFLWGRFSLLHLQNLTDARQHLKNIGPSAFAGKVAERAKVIADEFDLVILDEHLPDGEGLIFYRKVGLVNWQCFVSALTHHQKFRGRP